jgi:molecular chaperone HscB
MQVDFSRNHFELFGLPVRFELDKSALDLTFRALQTQVHPDRFAHLSQAEQRASMQWSTRINEAYQTLKSPLKRANYVLQLQGVDALAEQNTSMPADFLMQQIEWREAIQEARDSANAIALQALEDELNHTASHLRDALGQQLDLDHDYLRAAEAVRKLKFMDKLVEEIHDAFEAIDN